jgi:hypothetical protein
MKYAVTVTTTGGAMTDTLTAELGELGAVVRSSADPHRCDASFTIDAADAPSAAALAIEGVRAVRGDVTVDALEVVTTLEWERRLTDSGR